MGHVSCTEEIKATPEQVWAMLTDATRLPEWAYKEGRFPYPVEGKYGSEQREGVGTLWVGVSADGQMATQKIIVWEPPRKFTYELQEMANAPLQMAQTNTFELEPVGDQTRVTWSVDWQLTGGFSLSSLLIRFSGNGAFEEMMAGSLENLKKLVENASSPANGST
jgi:carbon monoxide dehydrogenase subunit G